MERDPDYCRDILRVERRRREGARRRMRRLCDQAVQSAAIAGEDQGISQIAFLEIRVMHSPPRILIVDDNETNRDILVTRLGVHGYELLQAADGEEALVSAKQHLPDLILLDIMMPKLDGIEVTKRIKGDASMPFMPIILVDRKS